MIPNSQLIKNRVTVLARRGDERIPARRGRRIRGVLRHAAGAGDRRGHRGRAARARSAMSRAGRHVIVICVGLRRQRDPVFGALLAYRSHARPLDRFAGAACTSRATLARDGMEIPLPQRVLIQAATPQGGPERRERELAARSATLARAGTLRRRSPTPSGARWRRNSPTGRTSPDDIVARQGEPADSLYILAHGRVGVFDDSAGGTGARDRLATLEAPAYFGEMGLLTGQARGRPSIAETEVLCYRLDKAGFEAIAQGAPGAGRADVARRRGAADRPTTPRSQALSAPTARAQRRRPVARRSSCGGSGASSRSNS